MFSRFKSLGITFLLIVTFPLANMAHEGMWIPSTLAKLVIGDMQDAGLRLTAEEIYSINQSSLKDAIVHFGGGCTASVISEDGLILTNHHCGYGQIQSHSSVEADYLKDGFWAMDRSQELPNEGLAATFVVRIEDVTKTMLKAAGDLEGDELNQALAAQAKKLQDEAVAGTQYEAEVKPFFYGNEYYMIVTETYRDVRLVGAPPSSVGKFGGDTDNWMWPRHTGDFSLFRIYASPNNEPASYSEENVPFKADRHLAINMEGLEPGDFTMVFGFPGTTEQYLTSYAVDYVVNIENPAKIDMREASLNVIDAAMEASDKTRIQYAAKQSRISNAYKKWIGQSMGLERYDAIGTKKAHEEKFVQMARSTKGYEGMHSLMSDFEVLYTKSRDVKLARNYLIEMYYYGPEVIRFAQRFGKIAGTHEEFTDEELQVELNNLVAGVDGFYKDYDAQVDRDIFKALWPLFDAGCPEILSSATADKYLADLEKLDANVNKLYEDSFFDDKDELVDALDNKNPRKSVKAIVEDPLFQIGWQLLEAYRGGVQVGYGEYRNEEDAMMKVYLKNWMALMPLETYSPDANSTLRLTYGKMEGSEPVDGVEYQPYTTMDGIVSKYIPGDKEFDVPQKLLDLHANQDYGKYATDGELRVCFLGSNHTTGGNSGSPAIDANGNLVGLNFDRTWESTMSDIMFSEEICRNIMVDVKYVLFIVDKYAGAGHLVEEMDLIWSSKADKLQIPEEAQQEVMD